MAKTGTMQHAKAFKFITDTVDDTTALSLIDFGFTEDEVKSADLAIISVETADIRYRIDPDAAGTPPTTTQGHLVPADQEVVITGFSNLMQMMFICSAGTATLQITLARMWSN